MKKEGEKPEVTSVEVTKVAPVTASGAATVPGSDRLHSFMQGRYPDKTWADDDEFYSNVADYLEDSGRRISEYENADTQILNIAKEYPEILSIIKDIVDGKSFEEALARNIDIEELIPREGEPDFAKYDNARKERKARRAEAEAYRAKLDKNMEKSREVLKSYFEEHGMSDEEALAFSEYIDNIVSAYLDRAITPEILDIFNHARNYDKDMAEARTAGEAVGRNAKIDAEREKRDGATDGLPGAGSSAGTLDTETPKEKNFIDNVLEQTSRRRNW